MLEIKELDYSELKGKSYKTEIRSNKYLSIEPMGDGFDIKWVDTDKELVKPFFETYKTL